VDTAPSTPRREDRGGRRPCLRPARGRGWGRHLGEEFFEDEPSIDTIIVAVGGGGLYAGVAAAALAGGVPHAEPGYGRATACGCGGVGSRS
jgi:hypothetical protein